MVVTTGRIAPADPLGEPPVLYIAGDDTKTVVSVLAPLVDGPADHTTIGPITTITPHPIQRPEYPGGALQTLPAPRVLTNAPRSGAARIAGVASLISVVVAGGAEWAAQPWLGLGAIATVAVLGCWQALRRHLHVERVWTRGHRILTDHDDRDVFRVASSATRRALHAWPQLQVETGLDEAGPVLARSLWDLADVLATRATVRESQTKLETLRQRVPADSTTHADLAARLVRLEEARGRHDDDVERRLGYLTTLADEISRFVHQQQAHVAAAAILRETDQILGSLTTAHQPAFDAAAELTERASAVLAAYRELTR